MCPSWPWRGPCHWPVVSLAPCGSVDDLVALGLCLECAVKPCRPEESVALDLSPTTASPGFSTAPFCAPALFRLLGQGASWPLKVAACCFELQALEHLSLEVKRTLNSQERDLLFGGDRRTGSCSVVQPGLALVF